MDSYQFNDSSFESLFAEVDAALTGKGSVKSLQAVLSAHRKNFLNCKRTTILRKPVIKESTFNTFRQHLDPGQVRQLNEKLGVQDETYCQALLLEAATQAINYGYEPEELAEFIHYRPRVFLFNALREILRARVDESQPYEIRTLLTKYISQMLLQSDNEGLIESLLNLLQAHLSSISLKSSVNQARFNEDNRGFTAHSFKETKLICECLFYLYYCDPQSSTKSIFKPGHLELLLQILEKFFSVEEVSQIQQIVSMVVFIVFCLFLNVLGAEKASYSAAMLARDVHESLPVDDEVLSSTFLSKMDNVLLKMRNKDAKDMLLCCWSVLVRKKGPAISSTALDMSGKDFKLSCDEGKAFLVLSTILKRHNYIEDELNFPHFGAVIDKLLTELIFFFFQEISELKREEEEQLAYAKERNRGPAVNRLEASGAIIGEIEERPRRFEELMGLMQRAYYKQPDLAEKYWDFRGEKDPENEKLHFFLGMAGRDGWQLRSPRGFCAYLDMLSSFASGSDNNCYYGFMTVRTGLNEVVRLSHFFDVMSGFSSELAKGQKLSPAHEEVVLSILKFLQAILGSEEVRRLMVESRDRPIDVLKTLLMTSVKPRLKSGILDTFRAFGQSPQIAQTIWLVLEVSGIISNNGIGLELLQESDSQTYPETISFLRLLERLLSVADARSLRQVTKQFRPDGSVFGPYLKFVIEEVLLKNDTRSFREPDLGEKWTLLSLCLSIMLKVLQRLDSVDFVANSEAKASTEGATSTSNAQPKFEEKLVDVTNLKTVMSIATNPFYELMSELLNGHVMNRILAMLRQDKTLEVCRFTLPYGKVMEDCCLYWLCILEEVAKKEDYFEDLLDILNDWDKRKFDIDVNPLSSLFRKPNSDDLDKSFMSHNLTQSYLGGSIGASSQTFVGHGGYGRNERKIPEPLLMVDKRTVVRHPLTKFMKHEKGSALLMVCHFVDYAINLELPLHAVRILNLLQPQISGLVDILKQSGHLPFIRLAFMNRLEDVHPTVQVKEEILRLLLASVKFARPNLAQVLLGYPPYDSDGESEAVNAINAAYLKQKAKEMQQKNAQNNAGKGFNSSNNNNSRNNNNNNNNMLPQNLQDEILTSDNALSVSSLRRGGDSANVWDETRGYCLGLILDLLRSPSTNKSSPELAQLCYELIYVLCATNFTATRILAYLRRTSHSFLIHHLNRLSTQSLSTDLASKVFQVDQLAWLLQIVALEIHVTAAAGREFLSQGLLQELFSIPTAEAAGNYAEDPMILVTESDLLAGKVPNVDEQFKRPRNRMKMVEILDVLDSFQFPSFNPLRPADLKVFKGVNVDNCRVRNEKGRKVIDLVQLHRVLVDFQAKIHEDGPMFIRNNEESSEVEAEELRSIMRDALRQNQYSEALMSRLLLFNSWRRVLEVTVLECYNNLAVSEVEPYLFELIEMLLMKLTHTASTHLPLLESIADTCLVLMTKLREQISYNHNNYDTQATAVRLSRTPIDRLQGILVSAISCVVDKTPSSASLRGSLYAFLVNYFQFTALVESSQEEDVEMLHARNGYAIRSVSDKLVEKLVGDCSYGADSWRSVAFACLDVLLSRRDNDTSHELLKSLSKKGFIHFFCNLQRYEESLRMSLTEVDYVLNTLYVWESQLSLLIRIAQYPAGILLLCEGGLLASLVELSFIDNRPSVSLSSDPLHGGNGWFPTLTERYEQIMYPLGLLISGLLSGNENADIIRHMLEFVTSHSQALIDILHDNIAVPSVSSLKLLRVWCSVFYSLAPYLHSQEAGVEINRKSTHYKELLMNLAHKYAGFVETGSRLGSEEVSNLSHSESDIGVEVLRMRQSLIGYFRRSMVGDGEHSVVFSAQLKEDCSRPPTKQLGSLSLLGFYLFDSSQCQAQLIQSLASLEVQLNRVIRSEMLPGEISKLVEHSGFSDPHSSNLSIKRRIAISVLTRQIKANKEARMVHQYIIENSLLILMRHLIYYCKQSDSLKQKLLRAASTSDRVGLLAILYRLSSSDDPLLFDMIRRLRNALER